MDISSVYACVFVLFVLSMVLAALNVIIGIFVNDAVEMARLDSDIKVQLELDEHRQYLQDLTELFQEIDTKHHGSITLEEFQEQMRETALCHAWFGRVRCRVFFLTPGCRRQR